MVNVGTGTSGTKIINTNYPVEEGLTAGTTKQTDREMNLVPEKSYVSEREKVGF
jgi:hypothetical protein